jgi:hypothetical protein
LARRRQDASETSSTILVTRADSYEIRGEARGLRVGCASVLKETESALPECQHGAVKAKRSRKERDKAALDAVAKEIARPQFAKSARQKEEAAGRRPTKPPKIPTWLATP